MFNFICVFPILFLGCFDRDVEKAYIQRNPHLYAIGPNGENLNSRVLARWLGLCIVFSAIFFYLSLFAFEDGGSMTSGYDGLMQYSNHGPGDGEGGGIIVFGTTVYAILILAMGYKVLYECRTIINGEWPFAFTRKDVGKERFWDRLAYSWVGVIWLSLFFFIFVAYVLQLMAMKPSVSFSAFSGGLTHTLGLRSIAWMLLIIIPTIAMAIDVAGKLFGTMYYPSQTQIHIEMQSVDVSKKKRLPLILTTKKN